MTEEREINAGSVNVHISHICMENPSSLCTHFSDWHNYASLNFFSSPYIIIKIESILNEWASEKIRIHFVNVHNKANAMMCMRALQNNNNNTCINLYNCILNDNNQRNQLNRMDFTTNTNDNENTTTTTMLMMTGESNRADTLIRRFSIVIYKYFR